MIIQKTALQEFVMPVKRFFVIVPSTWRNWLPAIFCRLSLMSFMPNIRSASEPNNLNSMIGDIVKKVFLWGNRESGMLCMKTLAFPHFAYKNTKIS